MTPDVPVLAFGRRWGHTDRIFVMRMWRNGGIARALIAWRLKVLRDAGMGHTTLDVESKNPPRTLQMYEDMGCGQELHFVFYKKDLG